MKDIDGMIFDALKVNPFERVDFLARANLLEDTIIKVLVKIRTADYFGDTLEHDDIRKVIAESLGVEY
ncbi:hypothetical protein [Actinopolyspora erythraea]|uniref:hypothetical protein n=1 Tax=Actinopolyspora erythraea TaxID=414996 RepID=UPI0011864096|nr:hypothetical protein [Actinopolyspora erythraea]